MRSLLSWESRDREVNPSESDVWVGKRAKSFNSDIAYVSQNPVLVMDTVAMELELPSKLHNELANAGQYFASLCGFEDRGGQRTDSLSGGEIQRLAFLRPYR